MSHKTMILSWLQSGKSITINVPNDSGKGTHARYSLATGSGSVCE